MTLKHLAVWSALLPASLVAVEVAAQTVMSRPDVAPAQAEVSLPDACKLLPQADLEAVFPERPMTSKGPTLSAVHKGPQYAQSCAYAIKLPSPTSKLEFSKFASVTIVMWGGKTEGLSGSSGTFASIRATNEKVAQDPKLNVRIEPVPNVGEEAFMETSSSRVAVRVRKADLIYVVSLDVYSPQTPTNAVALAAQIAKRWQGGVGMVEAPTPIAANSHVDIPEDARASSVAPASQWPDACALLTAEDVQAIFGDMKIAPARKTMGQIKHESRIDRVESLPNPIRCLYQTSRSDLVNGERRIVTHDANLNVTNVAATLELSKKFYQTARKVGDAKTEIAGLGDEASISPMNAIYIRKGLLIIEVRVSGGDRDRALYDDATRRVNSLAKLVAARLP